jgi:uncharacterized membrane protein (TIGR02234 family)
MIASRREYTLALLVGAVGAGLIWLALREQWAQAVFTQPKPLPQQTVSVSGADLAPVAGALAVAALACLAAVIATRGVWRRAAGVLLALFGAGAGASVTAAVTAASVVSVAASHVGSPESAAISGTAGSTTSGSSAGTAVVVAGSAGHAVIGGASWRALVIVGALMIFAAGLATVLRGADWPVMSSRYELPRNRPASSADEASGAAGHPSRAVDASTATDASAAREAGAEANRRGTEAGDTAAVAARQPDSASMWESLSGGEDPTG